MATIYLRAGRAYLNWVEGGKRHRQSLGAVTASEAEAALTGLERRLAGLHSAAGPIFAEWALEYARWHSDEYPDSYFRVEQILRCYLIPFFDLMPIGGITRQDAERYKHARRGQASPGTITKEMRTLQAVLNKAVDWARCTPRTRSTPTSGGSWSTPGCGAARLRIFGGKMSGRTRSE